MEHIHSSNQLNNDGVQNQFPTQNHSESQVTTPQNSISGNLISESSILALVSLDDTITYEICNAPDSDSLLIEILSRMPLKSIFRFKCVCKHWLTLLSHPSFSRFCLSRANVGLPFRIMYKYVDDSEFKDVVARFHPQSLDSSDSLLYVSREQHKCFTFKVLAVSNGLILCCSVLSDYYVCDPVSGFYVTLPERTDNNKVYIDSFTEGFVTRVNADNVVTSFTVVRVKMLDSRLNLKHFGLDTFSSETGKWVDYELHCPDSIELLKRSAGPISFNGILHWFVSQHGMVAFDPYKDPKSCRVIQFPDDRDVESEKRYDGLYRLCDGCQGKLRFFEVAPDVCSVYCFSMWEMNDYEKGEWGCAFKVTRGDLSSSDPELESWLMKATFLPLCFHPFDPDIFYLRCVELACVVSYDIRNRRLDVASKPVIDDISWRVVMPFVIQRWPTRVPIPFVPKKVSKLEFAPCSRRMLKRKWL